MEQEWRWKCWREGDPDGFQMSAHRSPTMAAETFVRTCEGLTDGETCMVRVCPAGAPAEAACLVNVTARMELFSRVVEVPT